MAGLTHSAANLVHSSAMVAFVDKFVGLLTIIIPLFIAAAIVGALMRMYTPRLLTGRWARSWLAYPVVLGVSGATPFCTVGTSTLVATLIDSGFPLGPTITFLVNSPLTDPLALVLLARLFSLKVAIEYYVLTGAIALVLGITLSRRWTPETLRARLSKGPRCGPDLGEPPSFRLGVRLFFDTVRTFFVGVFIGASIGAAIEGFVPTAWVAALAHLNPFLGVPLAVALGAPIYANSEMLIPVVYAFYTQGMNVGVGLAFLIAATGMGVPEFIVLSRGLRPRFLVQYAGAMFAAFTVIGLVMVVGH
jgi:uncharacterized membrane protein YraQ (UPF0718 family)